MSYRLAESHWFYTTGDGYKIHPTCTIGLRHARLYDRIDTLDDALKRLARKKSTVEFERYPHFEGWSVREYRLEDAETGEIIEYAGMLVDGLAEAEDGKRFSINTTITTPCTSLSPSMCPGRTVVTNKSPDTFPWH